MRPEILSVTSHPLGGLNVCGRFACGHVQTNVFPHAPARTLRRELVAWMFGPRGDERCTRCQRQATPARSRPIRRASLHLRQPPPG
jgi:hypothetical protein